MTYDEVIVLRDKLASGEIDLAFAKSEYWKNFKEGERSWKTKDWKVRRDKIIKDACQICGSRNTLTLQHGSHPRKYFEFLKEVTKTFTTEYINANPTVDMVEFTNYVAAKYSYIPVPLCPNCKSRNPNKRARKIPHYLCTACRFEFDNPVNKSIEELLSFFFNNEDVDAVRDKCFISKDEWNNKQNLASIKYWMQREQAKDKYGERIERQAFLLYLADSINYLSFVDTITTCKRCAYNYDIKKLELCPQCKEYYKGLQYTTCIQCLPEEKRKAALARIESGKQWQQMHNDLGID